MLMRVPRQVFDRQGFLSIEMEAAPGAISSALSQWSISSDIRVASWLSHRIALRFPPTIWRLPCPINKTLANQPFPVINGRTTAPCP